MARLPALLPTALPALFLLCRCLLFKGEYQDAHNVAIILVTIGTLADASAASMIQAFVLRALALLGLRRLGAAKTFLTYSVQLANMAGIDASQVRVLAFRARQGAEPSARCLVPPY